MRRKSPLLSLAVVVAFFLFGGCASDRILVRVEQTASRPSIPHAEKVNLYVERFSDVRGRKDPKLIGEGKTGMFNKSTPIVVEDDIEELSTRVLREAFSKTGFNVVTDEEEADLVFKGRINTFWVQEIMGALSESSEADVEFDVVLIDRLGKNNVWFDVKSSHVEASSMIDVSSSDEEVVNEALNEVVESIVSDAELLAAVRNFAASKF